MSATDWYNAHPPAMFWTMCVSYKHGNRNKGLHENMSLFQKASNCYLEHVLGPSWHLTPSFLRICWDFSAAMLCPNKIFHEHLPCKNHHNRGPWCLCWDLRLRNASGAPGSCMCVPISPATVEDSKDRSGPWLFRRVAVSCSKSWPNWPANWPHRFLARNPCPTNWVKSRSSRVRWIALSATEPWPSRLVPSTTTLFLNRNKTATQTGNK